MSDNSLSTSAADQHAQTRANDGAMDFDPITAFALRNWMLIGGAALLGAILGLVAAFVLPKTYRAEVIMAPVAVDSGSPLKSLLGQYGGLAGLAGVELPKLDESTDAAVAMLTSRSFIENFISDNKLLPVLFADHWDAKNSQWKLGYGDRPPALQDGFEFFRRRVLTVLRDAKTQIITVRVDWTHRTQAATWANALVARVNETARLRAIANASRSVEFLDRELEHTQAVEIRQSIYSLLQTQINKRMMATTRPDFAFSIIDPARPSEPDRYVRPIPLLLAALGFFSGGLLGIVVAIVRSYSAFWPRLTGRS